MKKLVFTSTLPGESTPERTDALFGAIKNFFPAMGAIPDSIKESPEKIEFESTLLGFCTIEIVDAESSTPKTEVTTLENTTSPESDTELTEVGKRESGKTENKDKWFIE